MFNLEMCLKLQVCNMNLKYTSATFLLFDSEISAQVKNQTTDDDYEYKNMFTYIFNLKINIKKNCIKINFQGATDKIDLRLNTLIIFHVREELIQDIVKRQIYS